MPYTGTIEVPCVSALVKLLRYLQDEKHRNHAPKGYRVAKMESAHPELTPKNFVATAKQIIAQLNAGNRGGAPVKNLATLHIMRMPYDTRLSPRERRYIVLRYIRDLIPDGLALHNWHINPLHGSDDLNVMVLNSTSLEAPRTRRRSNIDPIAQARRVADRITDRLNDRRRALGKELIVTMQEVQVEIARERRGENLEGQLAALPTNITLNNLRDLVEGLGHTITEFKPERNHFRVRFKTAKALDEIIDKKKRQRSARGPKFNLIDVLTKVWRLRRLKSLGLVAKSKAQLAAFDLPKDAEIHRIIEEEIQKQTSRSPKPSPEPPASPELSR